MKFYFFNCNRKLTLHARKVMIHFYYPHVDPRKRKEKLNETVEEINNIKQEMSEMKDMLRQLLENKSNGN